MHKIFGEFKAVMTMRLITGLVIMIHVLAIISGCGPSEREVKEEIESRFSNAAANSALENDPCQSWENYREIQSIQKQEGISLLSLETENEIAKFRPLCQAQMVSEYKERKKPRLEYVREKNCVGALSYARDVSFDSGQTDLYLSLTELQNSFYMKHPSGHFPSRHITAQKEIVEVRTRELGLDYLSETLQKCGWDSVLK